MCYYNNIKVTHGELIQLKQLAKMMSPVNIPVLEGPLYSAKHPVLKPIAGKEDFEIVNMEWGFIPNPKQWPFLKTREQVDKWRRGYADPVKGFIPGFTTLNAKCENIFINERGMESMYAEAAMERRMLMLSTGFFEWRHLPQIGKKGQPLKAMAKYPYFVYIPELLDSGKPFYMPGIWNPWTDLETGEYVETYASTTTKANFLMRQVHNAKLRMPTILNEDLAYEWMFGKLSKERILEIAATQYPSGKMWAYTIDKDFKNAVDTLAPFDYGDLVPALIQEAA